jgi:hypothetical protein
MYCQYCGKMIEDSDAKKCLACGQEVVQPNQGFPWRAVTLLVVLALIVVAVYMLRNTTSANKITPAAAGVAQANPENTEPKNSPATGQLGLPNSYQLSVSFGDIGPQLLAAGAIDYDLFVQIYERAGKGLDDSQLAMLEKGNDAPVAINQDNAYFLLNFLWALGLTNQNPLLDEGPLMEYSEGDIGRFASTGGWTLGKKPATELYSSTSLVSLTAEQQARLESVAHNVYRPCCDNHTAFADCNHGMAMLGLLELMAGQGASEDEMFEAAKYVNSFWFPQQALETAVFFQATMGLEYDELDGRMAVGPEVFSGSGFQSVHEWLANNGQLEQAPNSGGGCGV